MKFRYLWNEEKNTQLKVERSLSFEMVVEAAEAGLIIDEFDHPSVTRPNQRILVISVDGYMVSVPHLADGDAKFLKTMFFDRNLQKKYGGKNG
jgi:hypothetical protein